MQRAKLLNFTHMISTIWFVICACIVLVYSLHEAGVKWWVIFTLSGHSTVLILFFISLYLFAIFRGASKTQKIAYEHPLTSSEYYMMLYCITPFLGGLAEALNVFGHSNFIQSILGISYGTIWATFTVWIIVDPAISMIEMLLPASRKARAERLKAAHAERERIQREREKLLQKIEIEEKVKQQQRHHELAPLLETLLKLFSDKDSDYTAREQEIIEVGVKAWQIGGIESMNQLHDMATEQLRTRYGIVLPTDYISRCWDGIGQWTNKPLSQKGNPVFV